MALSPTNMSQPMDQASRYMYVSNVTSFDRQFLHWSFIVLEVAATVTIVVGDISMLMLFFTRKLLGQSTNILVFSVAIGDLVNGVLTFPLAMLQKIMYEPSEFMCKGYFYFANVSKTAVAYTILLLAMERIAAVLNCTYRILPPGRCLFFASLTWFFAAAYNIWSVVIYDMETVKVRTDYPDRTFVKGFSICFASERFMYLHEIFEYLNPLVTFAFPVISSGLLFLGFWFKKHNVDKPGRPYKSSKSVIIFAFALLVSFLATHIPWEVANLVFAHNARYHTIRELIVLKVLHIITFSRGFWDIFIFGAFRRYVCKKEKALAHFREQRSLQVQRSSLSIPINTDRPASLSLLDSDPSVSRRYSSDGTISRRPSAADDISMCENEAHYINGSTGSSTRKGDKGMYLGEIPNRRKSTTITTTIISENYLIPRSPCLHDHSRRFSFAPPQLTSNAFPTTVDETRIPKNRKMSNEASVSDSKSSPLSSTAGSNEIGANPTDSDDFLVTSSTECGHGNIHPATSSLLVPSSQSLSSTSSPSSSTTTMTTPTSVSLKSSLSPPQQVDNLHPLKLGNRKKKKSCSFQNPISSNENYLISDTAQAVEKNVGNVGNSDCTNSCFAMRDASTNSGKKLSLFLETTFDLIATSPTTIAVTLENAGHVLKLCENDL